MHSLYMLSPTILTFTTCSAKQTRLNNVHRCRVHHGDTTKTGMTRGTTRYNLTRRIFAQFTSLFGSRNSNHQQHHATPTTAEPHHGTTRSPESNQQNWGRIQDMPPSGPHLLPEPRILEHTDQPEPEVLDHQNYPIMQHGLRRAEETKIFG